MAQSAKQQQKYKINFSFYSLWDVKLWSSPKTMMEHSMWNRMTKKKYCAQGTAAEKRLAFWMTRDDTTHHFASRCVCKVRKAYGSSGGSTLWTEFSNLVKNYEAYFPSNFQELLTCARSYIHSHIWPPLVAIFLTLWVWEAFAAS